jgi:hypothetical protein
MKTFEKPIFVENSRIPIILSRFAPIEIGAITLGFIVFSRDEMSETTKRHETIHYQQFLETLFIGFLFIYFFDYLYNRFVLGMNGQDAYFNIRAEKEAYRHDVDETYLDNRKRYAWLIDC